MTVITGGNDVALDTQSVGDALGYGPGSAELRILDAVVACAARWGMDKTTVDDVANEAGLSRATVYRLFPGGKPSIVRMATDREAVVLLGKAMERISACEALPEAITELISAGHDTLASQAELAYMRANEPAKLRLFFSFERLDGLLQIAADVVSPSLGKFLGPAESRIAVIWVARLVVSHFVQPGTAADLSDPAVARRITDNHIIPGLHVECELRGNPILTTSRSTNEHQ